MIARHIDRQDLHPAQIRKALCMWCRAIYKYHRVVVAAQEAKSKAELLKASKQVEPQEDTDPSEVKLTEMANVISMDSYIHKADVVELKCVGNPPQAVKTLLECVLILRPLVTETEDSGWQGATKMLGDVKFAQALQNYERKSVSDEQLRKVQEILRSDDVFLGENMKKVSRAAYGLLRWVRAVVEPHDTAKVRGRPGEHDMDRATAAVQVLEEISQTRSHYY